MHTPDLKFGSVEAGNLLWAGVSIVATCGIYQLSGSLVLKKQGMPSQLVPVVLGLLVPLVK